ncbi:MULTISPECIES: hypothetical protein [unclassified Clostridium]|uniref:hypothetical protein n=1 Tax=unclassified Clostridium TaxID=2614128 RepID=UPI000297C4CA|nr:MULTISPECIES: hypothetical protein [unclassified Clostridium]EKQ57545.1 MAG: hypothetical protein A370_00798 [Clostridium sp. Maddingley MBC34-26]
MQHPYDIREIEKTKDTSDNIEFTEISGQYSCNVAKAILDVTRITMKLTKVDTNVIYGDYAYLIGYYDPNTSTLTGTWMPSWDSYLSHECPCAHGTFRFNFYKRNEQIGFNGTLKSGNSENGNYANVEYWVGIKIKDV